MSKHQEILDYLENLAIGKRVSVRSISNHLKVSDGTAYRAIKEAENRGIVETRPRSGTVRVEPKMRVRMDRLTYAEIARISDSDVVAGQAGLGHEFSKFSIGAMTRENILRYLIKGGLLIVGDREDIQLLALDNHNAVLVTGGFPVSERVKKAADMSGIPVMVTYYDTFSVATMINQALSNLRIKTDIKTVEQVYQDKESHGFLYDGETVAAYHALVAKTKYVRFPVVNQDQQVVGVVSLKDLAGEPQDRPIGQLMANNPLVTKPSVNLSNISQKMIFEDYAMVPVVGSHQELLGVMTRRHAMESLQNLSHPNLHTYSEQILANLMVDNNHYRLIVEPAMLDHTGNLAQGVLSEYLKEITIRLMTKKSKKTVTIEQLMVYFLEAIAVDDVLHIETRVVTEKKRHSAVDIEVYREDEVVAKALITAKLN